MNKLIKKASSPIENRKAKFERYFLSENPFPSTPIVNNESNERKFNGSIYEQTIRKEEYNQILENFLRVPQNDPNHLRLGFIIDSSYIGRGNGKSAFLVNLMRDINKEYCLDLSNEINKCFAIYFSPEGGGKVKTFERFLDSIFNAILKSNIINVSLAILRFEALQILVPELDFESEFPSEQSIIENLNNNEWFNEKKIYKSSITTEITKNSAIGALPFDFPLYQNSTSVLKPIVTQIEFEEYYNTLKRENDKLDFIFNHLVIFFQASGFNGAYVIVDDFERIPDFQSAIQKRDFVTQLRTVLLDGSYESSKSGFYNFILALHAGVPRLIQEAWNTAGLEQRISMTPSFSAKHCITFDKINEKHAVLLVEKYLNEFRISPNSSSNTLFPFDEGAIKLIAKQSEMNASRILQIAYNLIDTAASTNMEIIDEKAVQEFFSTSSLNENQIEEKSISNTATVDLLAKAKGKHL